MSIRRKIALLALIVLFALGVFMAVGGRIVDRHVTQLFLEGARESARVKAMELRDRSQGMGRVVLEAGERMGTGHLAELFIPYLDGAPETSILAYGDAGRFHFFDLERGVRVSQTTQDCATADCLVAQDIRTGASVEAPAMGAEARRLMQAVSVAVQGAATPTLFLVPGPTGQALLIASVDRVVLQGQTLTIAALYQPERFAQYVGSGWLDGQSYVAMLLDGDEIFTVGQDPQTHAMVGLDRAGTGLARLDLMDFAKGRQAGDDLYSRPGSQLWMGHVFSGGEGELDIFVLSHVRPFFRVVYEDQLFLTLAVLFVVVVVAFSAYLFMTPGKGLGKDFFSSALDDSFVRKVILAGESRKVEFKSTLRKNLKSGKNDKGIELACLKTVAAFLNSEGGVLLVGVDDAGKVLGLDADGFSNADHALRHLRNLLNQHVGVNHASGVSASVVPMDGGDVLAVLVEQASEPAFVTRKDGDDAYYVRTGPATKRLTFTEFYEVVRRKNEPGR